MEYFKKILRFAKPYAKYGYLNIFFNILYALFSTLGFVALIPMLEVLFDKVDRITVKPTFHGLSGIKDYAFDYLNFHNPQ